MATIVDFETANGDLVLTGNNFTLVYDQYAVAQAVEATLNTHTGEWFLDDSFGVQYRDKIWVKNPDLSVVSALLLAAVRSVPGIIRIVEYDIDFDTTNRRLEMDIIAQSVWGPIVVTEDPDDIWAILTYAAPAGPFRGD